MIIILFTITILAILTDLFLMGSIVGFFQKKIVPTDLAKFLVPTIIISITLLVGVYLGSQVAKLFAEYNVWYAATIIFVLSLKLMYDGIKLDKLKKSINPIDTKGLFYLSFLMAINAFFIGLAFGFLGLLITQVLYFIVSIYFAILAGYLKGFSLKKLIGFRNDLLFAAVFLIVALVIAVKL